MAGGSGKVARQPQAEGSEVAHESDIQYETVEGGGGGGGGGTDW